MSDTDDPLEMYQAFHLGLMIAAMLRDEDFTVARHRDPALAVLRELVAKETTLHDPQAEASKNPEIAAIIASSVFQVIEVHRKIAAKILRSRESQVQVREFRPE